MKGWGAVALGVAVMAAVALLARAYLALGSGTPDWKVAIDALVATVSVITALITFAALRIAADSADAAKAAAQVATATADSIKRAERAYIRLAYDPVSVETGRPILHLCAVNAGKTAARIDRLNWEIFDKLPDPMPSPDEFLARAMRPSFHLVGSDERIRVWRQAAHQERAVLLACAEYVDIYGTRRRTTSARELELKTAFGFFAGPPEWNWIE